MRHRPLALGLLVFSHSLAFPFVFLALQPPLWAQTGTPPVLPLARPEAEVPQSFVQVLGVRELSDGRVLVLDGGEKLVAIVDFARGQVARVGREGAGPGEFLNPARLLSTVSDTTIVSELTGRLSRIDGSGHYAGEVRLPERGSPNPGPRAMRGLTRMAADGQGRIYREGSRPPRSTGKADSVPIERIDLAKGTTDTAAWLPVPPLITERTRNGGGVSLGGRREGPFVAQATWQVAPDGRVGVVTPVPYQVTWFRSGSQRIVGPTLTYQVVPVTAAEKQAYRDNYPSAPNMSMSIAITSTGATSYASQPIPFREPEYWPAQKDPFGNGTHTVLASPSGDLWILKQLPHTDQVPTYDLIGPTGALVGRVTIPPRSRVVGFGRNGAVYLYRMDEDDLQYLQRARLR